jgi:hypothetical protein
MVTLEDVETALTALAEAPGLFVNERLALAGNVTTDEENVLATFVDGEEATLAPEAIGTVRGASADDAGEAGRALAAVR